MVTASLVFYLFLTVVTSKFIIVHNNITDSYIYKIRTVCSNVMPKYKKEGVHGV